MSKLHLVLLALVFVGAVTAADSCTALVIEGGGDLGAYEAGVIKGLIQAYNNNGTISGVEYDVFSG